MKKTTFYGLLAGALLLSAPQALATDPGTGDEPLTLKQALTWTVRSTDGQTSTTNMQEVTPGKTLQTDYTGYVRCWYAELADEAASYSLVNEKGYSVTFNGEAVTQFGSLAVKPGDATAGFPYNVAFNNSTFSTPGIWQFTFNEGAFTYGAANTESPEITWEINLAPNMNNRLDPDDAESTYLLDITPAAQESVTSLTQIVIRPYYSSSTTAKVLIYPKAAGTVTVGDAIYEFGESAFSINEDGCIVITLPEIAETGNCTVHIYPQSFFVGSNDRSRCNWYSEIELNYTIGEEAPALDSVDFEDYLSGILPSTDEPATLENLGQWTTPVVAFNSNVKINYDCLDNVLFVIGDPEYTFKFPITKDELSVYEDGGVMPMAEGEAVGTAWVLSASNIIYNDLGQEGLVYLMSNYPGVTYSIPAGLFLVETEEGYAPMGAYSFGYTFGEAEPIVWYEITPNPEEELTELSEIVISNVSAYMVSWDDNEPIVLQDAQGNEIQSWVKVTTGDNKNWNAGSEKATLTLTEPITTPGAYTLVVSDDCFLLDGGATKGFKVVFNVVDGNVVNDWCQVIPDPQQNPTSFSDFQIQVNGNGVLAATDDLSIQFTKDGELVQEWGIADAYVVQMSGAYAAYVALDENVSGVGVYVLSINQGGFTLDGTPTAAVSLTYNLEADGLAIVSADPADGSTVTKLATVTITLNQNVVIKESGVTVYIQKFDGDTYGGSNYMGVMYQGAAANEAVITICDANKQPATITEPGDYSLWFETIDGSFSDISGYLYLYYTVSEDVKVGELFGDAANGYDVYTFQGIQVLRGASAADVKALPQGLYIINGKKVVIR